MKNFIITVGLVLFVMTMTSYQVTCNKMLRQKCYLKFTAEECAATAGLFYDEEAFSRGYIRFDRERGEQAARSILRANSGGKSCSMTITFHDEKSSAPSVKVILYRNKIKAVGVYEYKGW